MTWTGIQICKGINYIYLCLMYTYGILVVWHISGSEVKGGLIEIIFFFVFNMKEKRYEIQGVRQ